MSYLLNAKLATVTNEKISDYLLNPKHPQNGGKNKFFAAFGFTRAESVILKSAIEQHPVDNEINEDENSVYGQKFVVMCHLQTPDGRNPCIVSVWIMDTGTNIPRFVTAYPNDMKIV